MTSHQTQMLLYLLQCEPIYQDRHWGARRLGNGLAKPLPAGGPIGEPPIGESPISELWERSGRNDHQCRLADGSHNARSPGQLIGIDRHDYLGVPRLETPQFLPPGRVAGPPEAGA